MNVNNDISFDGNGHISQYSGMSGANDNILMLRDRRNDGPNMRQRREAAREAQRLRNMAQMIVSNARNVNMLRADARDFDARQEGIEQRTNNASRGTIASSHLGHVDVPFNNFNVDRPFNDGEFQQMIQNAVHAQISNTKACHFNRAARGGELLNRRWPWQYGSGWIKNVNEIYKRYLQRRVNQRAVLATLQKVPDGCCLCCC